MEHETGRSRGTGFVCFWNKEHADRAIEQSEILRAETLGNASAAVCSFIIGPALFVLFADVYLK